MSTPSNPLEGLDIKAGTQSGAAPLAANLAARGFSASTSSCKPCLLWAAAPDDSEDSAAPATAVPNSPEPSAPSSSAASWKDKYLTAHVAPEDLKMLRDAGHTDEYISGLDPKIIAAHRAIIGATEPPSHAAPAGSPFAKPADNAAPILSAEPISDDLRSQIWDVYHNSRTPSQFADAITPIPVSNDLKSRLWTQKTQDVQPVAVAPVDKVEAAITKMVALPADVLKIAEENPHLLAAFTSAATKA